MEQIKIQKEFWDKIVSGEKKYEFRKLEKDLTTGTYEFVSIDTVCRDHNRLSKKEHKCFLGKGAYIPKETFGTAHLKLVAANPYFTEYEGQNPWDHIFAACIGDEEWLEIPTDISMEQYKDIKENFIDKKKDFLVYEISDVKEGK